LREYTAFTRNLTLPCKNLDRIQGTAHDWLLRDSKRAGVGALDASFIDSLKFDSLYSTSETSAVARALLQELAALCQDPTVGAQARVCRAPQAASTTAS
jgi:hypothetical protein